MNPHNQQNPYFRGNAGYAGSGYRRFQKKTSNQTVIKSHDITCSNNPYNDALIAQVFLITLK